MSDQSDRDLIEEVRRNFHRIAERWEFDLYDRLTARFTAVLDELAETTRHLEIARGQADVRGEEIVRQDTDHAIERAKLREERDRAVRDVFLAVEQRDAAKRLLSEIGAIVEHDGPLDDSLVAKVRKVTRLALATDYDIGSS